MIHDSDNCKQEPAINAISRQVDKIDTKVDKIDEKLDAFIERQAKTETKLGFISTGFLVLVAPVLVGIILYLIKL